MQAGVKRRALLVRLMGLAWSVSMTPGAHAVMAGAAEGAEADSPQRRVDPNTTDSPWAGVGALLNGSGVFGGVLISPRHVLTAAHVVAGAAAESVVYVLNAGGDTSHRLAAAGVHVHPEFRSAAAGQVMEHDIAIVELREPASGHLPVYALLEAPLRVGQRISFIGYGGSGLGSEGVSVAASASVKRVGSNRIDQFVFARDNADRRIGFLFDFDGPALDTNVIGPSVFSNGSLGNRLESTFAGGDSGSPSFARDRRGRWVVIGVNTFVGQSPGRPPGTFGSIAGGMLVSAYLPWIRTIVPEVATVR